MANNISVALIFGLVLTMIPACQGTPSVESTPIGIQAPTEAAAPAATPNPGNIAAQYPLVDGSTSAHPLQVFVACKIMNLSCAWMPDLFSERRVFPENSLGPSEAVEKVFAIWHNGTHSAYVNLIEKEADFILAARVPSEDELRLAERKGVTLDIRPVALDAFVFLAHAENPVDTLTTEQARGIYTGKVTDWEELGGTGAINAYQRNPNSGSQELMQELVMQGAAMIEAPDMVLLGMMGPINAIHDDPEGIGYSVYFYATNMLPDENVRLLGLNGILPTSETIARRTYPLVTGVYAVVRSDTPADSTAAMLRDWLFTEAGQEVVKESGYVPIR